MHVFELSSTRLSGLDVTPNKRDNLSRSSAFPDWSFIELVIHASGAGAELLAVVEGSERLSTSGTEENEI